jgi:hypothetical protein
MPGYTDLNTAEQSMVKKLSLGQQNLEATRSSTRDNRELTKNSKKKDTNNEALRKDKSYEISRQVYEALENLKDACLVCYSKIDAIDTIDAKSTLKKDKPAEEKATGKRRKLGRKVPT